MLICCAFLLCEICDLHLQDINYLCAMVLNLTFGIYVDLDVYVDFHVNGREGSNFHKQPKMKGLYFEIIFCAII